MFFFSFEKTINIVSVAAVMMFNHLFRGFHFFIILELLESMPHALLNGNNYILIGINLKVLTITYVFFLIDIYF